MKNYVQDGVTLTLTAPSGGVVSGSAYLIGSILVVAVATVAETLPFVGQRCGVFSLPVTAANTPAEGGKAYWNDTAKEVTTTASGNTLVGVFVTAKDSNNDAEVLVTGQIA
jgi:predicted RecA/RadA family phage recombinase